MQERKYRSHVFGHTSIDGKGLDLDVADTHVFLPGLLLPRSKFIQNPHAESLLCPASCPQYPRPLAASGWGMRTLDPWSVHLLNKRDAWLPLLQVLSQGNAEGRMVWPVVVPGAGLVAVRSLDFLARLVPQIRKIGSGREVSCSLFGLNSDSFICFNDK